MNKKEKTKMICNMLKDDGFRAALNVLKHVYDLKRKQNLILASPISLQIEVTTRCNLKCPMCEHSFKEIKGKDLSFDNFVYILDQFPYLKNVTLQGLGEPLLNTDIFDMIREAKRRNIRIGFTTNATLLLGGIGEKLIDSGLDWLYISIDSVRKENYEKIRCGAKYEIVMENVQKFMSQKGDNLPDTNFWSLIMKDNIEDIPGVVEFAKELKMKRVVLQNVHNWGHDDFSNDLNKMKVGSQAEFEKMLDKIREVSAGVNVEVNTNQKQSNSKRCDWPWRSAYITVEGFVTPCCMQGADPDVINFGNIFEEQVSNILNNDKYREFRRQLKSNIPPRICKGCPAYFTQKVIKI